MDLQRIVWSWPTLIARLAADEPELSRALDRSCRPLAAERGSEGRLTLAVGCWLSGDVALLNQELNHARLANALGALLEERLELEVVPWPGGMAAPSRYADESVPAPDLLAGLPTHAREEAVRCESPIEKFFFAQAWRRGIKLRCQYSVTTYRMDFALPKERIGAEIAGWRWARRGHSGRYEREQQLGGEGWRVLWFSGQEVLGDVDRCLDQLSRLLPPHYRSRKDETE